MYKGEQEFPLTLIAASQLERNRLVTVTGQVPAYTGIGGRADGLTTVRGDEHDYAIAVTPLDGIQMRFTLELAGAVTVNSAVFAAADGKGVGVAGAAVANRAALAGTPTAGDVYFITNEGAYVVYSGAAWVNAEVVGYAAETGVAGAIIAVDRIRSGTIAREQLGNLNGGSKIVLSLLTTSETDANSQVVVTDSRLAVGDIAVASLFSAANAVYATGVAVGAGLCTISLSGNGGAGTRLNLIVTRSLDA